MLKDVPASAHGGPWLERLIVGVDSRRARRSLQNEFPREVYDASTTDIREVVLHFNRLPGEGLACMSCVYALEEVEQAHERHVAESLGVSLAEVQQIQVSDSAARKICERYVHLKADEIEGLAYDSLFKQVCSEGALKTAEDRQIFAPFSFISVLAGAYLAVELLRRLWTTNPLNFNYWRVSAWAEPNVRLQQRRPTNLRCQFCNDPILRGVAAQLWGAATLKEV